MLKKLSFILLSFALVSFSLSAQSELPGYVITQKGDTLKGSIVDGGEYKNNRSISFKAGGETAPKVYQPSELKGYTINNKEYYISKEVKLAKETAKIFFVREVVRGASSLHQLVTENKETIFILEKHTGEMIPLRAKYLNGTLKTHLADCSKMNITQRKYNYSRTSMVQMIQEYNACMSPGGKVDVLLAPGKLRTSFGIKVGGNFTKFHFNREGSMFYQSTFDRGTGITAGGVLSLTTNQRLHWNVEVLYSTHTGILNTSKSSAKITDLNLRINYIQPSLSARYDLTKTTVRPYVTAGTGLMMLAARNAISNDSRYPDANKLFNLSPPFTYNMMTGLGVSSQFQSRKKLSMEVRFNYATTFSKARTSYPSQLNILELSIGYTF